MEATKLQLQSQIYANKHVSPTGDNELQSLNVLHLLPPLTLTWDQLRFSYCSAVNHMIPLTTTN